MKKLFRLFLAFLSILLLILFAACTDEKGVNPNDEPDDDDDDNPPDVTMVIEDNHANA
jgi:hypothetical protein